MEKTSISLCQGYVPLRIGDRRGSHLHLQYMGTDRGIVEVAEVTRALDNVVRELRILSAHQTSFC